MTTVFTPRRAYRVPIQGTTQLRGEALKLPDSRATSDWIPFYTKFFAVPIFILIALFVWVLFLLRGKISPDCAFIKLLSDNPIWTSIFSVMFGALITGLKFVLKKLNVLTTDESIIRKRVEKKLSKD